MGNNLSNFQEGDDVVINITDLEVIEQMQESHGGWNEKMKECMTGPCKLVQGIGTDALIKGPSGAVYRVNPEILSKYVSSNHSPGTMVMITEKEEDMKQLQSGHGGWSDGMRELLGKGVEIVQRFPDGDYKVKYDNRTWTVNPACIVSRNNVGSAAGSRKLVAGDKVKMLSNKGELMSHQDNHGGWSDLMTLMLGQEVEIVEVMEDGDCYVSIFGMRWLVNPRCFENAEKDKTAKKEKLRKGDTVTICDNLERCKDLQQYHGGWVSAMKMFLGKTGHVDAVLPTGDIKVSVGGLSLVYNAKLLTKVAQDPAEAAAGSAQSAGFKIGDRVKVLKDKSKVKKLQKDHGEWVDSMRLILGERGKVKGIFPDGDLRVKIMGNQITLNPKCVRKVTVGSDSDSDVPDMMKMMRQMAKMMGQADDSDDDSDSDEDKEDKKDKTDGDISSMMKIEHMKLFAAVKTGDMEQTRVLVDLVGPNISKKKITPLMVAVSEGHERIVELLIAKGANVSAKDGDGDTSLHLAVQKNRTEMCRLLTEKGANVNDQNDAKMTALMLAAAMGSQDVLRVFLATAGVNLNLGDKDKDTALHLAIQKSRLDSVETLLDAGADFNVVNDKGFSAFHMAVLRGHEKILEAFLTRSGPSIVDVQKEDKFAAIHLAAINNHPGCLKLLITYRADINIRNSKLQTALHLAVSQRYLECVKILVEGKAEMNLKDDSGDTPLHDAVKGHNMDKMRKMGAMIGMPDMFKVLQNATQGSDNMEEIVLYLVQKGAKLDIKNSSGKTPINACDDEGLKAKLKSIRDGTVHAPLTTLRKESLSENLPQEAGTVDEIAALRLKVQKLEDENICIICRDRPIDCTYNCGHVSCETCARNLYECHICRVPITTRLKMYR